MNEPPSLLRNDGGNHVRVRSLKLVGVRSNRSASGAVVTLMIDQHNNLAMDVHVD
jgi:hypothetical protein